jgi:hypothetical protein
MSKSAGSNNRTARWALAVALTAVAWTVAAPAAGAADPDRFQQAVNYIFTGNANPTEYDELVDRSACVVVVPDPGFKRYIRYYLSRFRMDDAFFDKKYSGSRVLYTLDVKGDDIIIEYLLPDKQTVTQRYRTAQIPLPGDDIDLTQKAFKIVADDGCKPEKSKAPF